MKQKTKKKRKWIWVIGGIAALAAAIGIGYAVTRKPTPAPQPTTPTGTPTTVPTAGLGTCNLFTGNPNNLQPAGAVLNITQAQCAAEGFATGSTATQWIPNGS